MLHPGFRIAAAYAFAEARGLTDEAERIRSLVLHPSIARAAAVRKGYLVELFESSGTMDDFAAQHWSAYRSPAGQRRRALFLRRKSYNEALPRGERPPIEESVEGMLPDDDSDDLARFTLEAHLRDFLAANLGRITVESKKLALFRDQEKTGVEFKTDVGRIDILAVDTDGNLYVFELKLARGPDRALGQLARYMGWVRIHLAGSKEVTGVIVASTIDDRLRYAACVIPRVVMLEYEVDFRLRSIRSMSIPSEGSQAGETAAPRDPVIGRISIRSTIDGGARQPANPTSDNMA